MKPQLRIEPVNIETTPPDPRFDLVDTDGRTIATIYDEDERRAHFAALVLASALDSFELLRAIYRQTAYRGRDTLDYDQWLREIGEIVRRIEEGA